jgi:multiple sugar transport system substrate-binding protein
VAKQFHEDNPDIIVKVEEPNFFSEEPGLQTMIGDADCFQWWGAVSSEEDLQMVLALQPLLDADPDLSEEDFFPAALDRFRDQGQVIGLPAEVQIAFLSYNKRLFDAADLDYPQPGWTMDEFLETAVALTQGDSEEDKIYGYVPDLYEMGDMMTFVTRQGISFIDDSVDPPTLRFDDPETIAALRWYTTLTNEYGVKPVFDMSTFNSFGNPYEDRQAMIDNDRAAIWKGDQYGVMVGYDENGQPIEEEDNSHIGFVPYPVGPGGSAGFESVNGYYITAQTEVRQAAWEWLKYLTTQESLAQFGLPARISTAESDEFARRVSAEKAEVMIASVKNSTAVSAIDLYFQSSDWLGPALGIGLQEAYNNIIAEETTVEEALQAAQNKADTYRQCIIENDLIGSSDYQEYEACMEEANLSWNDF